ncbi:MAG: hypothetical protein VST72_06520 [Nitrospirota bacterium]|nr:hypothetical protein [Nitrospirota bacterium]
MRKKGLIFIIGMFLLSFAITMTGCGINDNTDVFIYSVGGTVFGLNGTVVLQNNSGDDLTITSDGAFTFDSAMSDGSAYNVTVATQPAGQICTVTDGTGTISGVDVTNVAVTCTDVITVSGTVEDAVTGTMLEGVTIETRYTNDTILATATTDASGAFTVDAPADQDFYLHANGVTISSVTYIAENLQIDQFPADQTGIKFYMVDDTSIGDLATQLGADTSTDALFAFDVEDSSSTGIAGITVSASPAVTNISYNQDGSTFSTTAPTTTFNGPSVAGYNSATTGTYTFSLTGTGYTIDATFSLRLIPGELSMPIEP